MRGFTVAQNKGLYIVSDAMREAAQIGFPWSAFADPVGAGTIRAFVVDICTYGHTTILLHFTLW